MYDYHMHTNYSFDASTTMEEYAKTAIKNNIGEICFTEHIEIGDPFAHTHTPFDAVGYTEEYLKIKASYPRLIIKQGAEIGLNKGFLEETDAFLRTQDYDFVIASQHAAGSKDPFFEDYFKGITLRQGEELFYTEMLENLKNYSNYDVIGHIGYVDKYLIKNNVEPKTPSQYKDFSDIFDEMLKCAIAKNKGIEINTSNIGVWGYPTPHISIIKRFLELKGEIITVGSDCHTPKNLGYKITQCYDLLSSLGVKYICTFTKRKAQMRRI